MRDEQAEGASDLVPPKGGIPPQAVINPGRRDANANIISKVKGAFASAFSAPTLAMVAA